MKKVILLAMSLLSFLFGCSTKKKPDKAEEWPRFPETDHADVSVTPVTLDDGFQVWSYYIAPDKQHIYLLANRVAAQGGKQKVSRNRPGEPDAMEYRLLCLDPTGKVKYQKELPSTDWLYGGTFGLVEGELMLRLGDWLLVLEPGTLAVRESIRVHDPVYISWLEADMTRDEHQADYQAKFEAMLDGCTTCNWLEWSPTQESMVLVQGEAGKREAWIPISEDEQLEELKQRFKLLRVTLNPQAMYEDSSRLILTDPPAQLREVEYLSVGTQLDYPTVKTRSVLQYELTVSGKKVRFSTTDRDRHSLHLGFSDNQTLSMTDGSVWMFYEDVLYRIQ